MPGFLVENPVFSGFYDTQLSKILIPFAKTFFIDYVYGLIFCLTRYDEIFVYLLLNNFILCWIFIKI